jgi:hypothetical protein
MEIVWLRVLESMDMVMALIAMEWQGTMSLEDMYIELDNQETEI